jgi:hypothetical protein
MRPGAKNQDLPHFYSRYFMELINIIINYLKNIILVFNFTYFIC